MVVKKKKRKLGLKSKRNNALDRKWKEFIKSRAGGQCEFCGEGERLNAHHIYDRSIRRLRWDIDNGMALCPLHHKFGEWSAHNSPIEFIEWLKDIRGGEWYKEIRYKYIHNKCVDGIVQEQEAILNMRENIKEW